MFYAIIDNNKRKKQMKTVKTNRLTVLVSRIIGVIWYVNILSFIAWPIMVFVIGFSIPSAIEDRHTDLDLLLGISIYPEVLQDTSQAGISGISMLHLNNTLGHTAWYYAASVPTLMSVFALFGIFQLRKIFASLAIGNAFTLDIPRRIKKFGFVLIAWSFIIPFAQYFVGVAVLKDIQFQLLDVKLYPSFQLSPVVFIAGLAIIVLSGVLREATNLHDEQELTI